MFQKRPSPLIPICSKKRLQKEVTEDFFGEKEDVRMEKGKEMDIRDAELIVDEEVEIKSEPVDDENDVQFVTDVVKEQTRTAAKKIRQEKKIKIIQIDNDLKVDFVDPKKCRPNVCVRLDTKKIQGPQNVVNNATLLNRLAIYQKTLQSLHCAICKVRNTLTMHIFSLQKGTYEICCSNCGLRIQDPQNL